MNSQTLSNKPKTPISNKLLFSFIAVGFAGFLDAAYLTLEHYTQSSVPCFIFQGCEQVTTSKYAVIGGVPVALLGALYYLAILAAAVLFLDTKNRRVLYVLGYLPILGLAAAAYFMSVQIFILKAICIYCLISAISSTVIFILGLYLCWKENLKMC